MMDPKKLELARRVPKLQHIVWDPKGEVEVTVGDLIDEIDRLQTELRLVTAPVEVGGGPIAHWRARVADLEAKLTEERAERNRIARECASAHDAVLNLGSWLEKELEDAERREYQKGRAALFRGVLLVISSGRMNAKGALAAAEAARDEAQRELRITQHERTLIAAAIGERGQTDCSTPLYIRIANVIRWAELAERQRDEAQQQSTLDVERRRKAEARVARLEDALRKLQMSSEINVDLADTSTDRHLHQALADYAKAALADEREVE